VSVWDDAEVLQHGPEDGAFAIACGKWTKEADGNHYYDYKITREEATELRRELTQWIGDEKLAIEIELSDALKCQAEPWGTGAARILQAATRAAEEHLTRE
jgi:hypothetical protein